MTHRGPFQPLLFCDSVPKQLLPSCPFRVLYPKLTLPLDLMKNQLLEQKYFVTLCKVTKTDLWHE